MIKIDTKLRQNLLQSGVSCLWTNDFILPDDCCFEAPCSIKWMSIEHSLKLGAFSYAVSGYFFACDIGRFTSIGEQVQIGRGNHPATWFSSSPVFYEQMEDVFNGVDLQNIRGFNASRLKSEPFQRSSAPSSVSRVSIGNDVWIGHAAFVKPGVKIGDGAIVGANAVVTKDVPAYAIVAGNPARIIRFRFEQETIEQLISLQWWNYTLDSLSGIKVDAVATSIDLIAARIANGQATPFLPSVVNLKELASRL